MNGNVSKDWKVKQPVFPGIGKSRRDFFQGLEKKNWSAGVLEYWSNGIRECVGTLCNSGGSVLFSRSFSSAQHSITPLLQLPISSYEVIR
jgi:hypothetical protein